MTTYDVGRVRHDGALMHYSISSNGSSVSSNWRLSATGDSGVTWSPESATSISYASNTNDVSSVGAVGASTLVPRGDHVHKGVTSIAVSSNTVSGPITLAPEGTIGLTVSGSTIKINSVGGSSSAAAAATTRPYPLDRYTIDPTYGTDFTTASLPLFTRRNFTSGAETYQVGYEATWIRIVLNGRANGDAYLETAPAGDWTIACKFVMRTTGPSVNEPGWGLTVVDTNGTGVSFLASYNAHTPWAPLLVNTTTYSTYGGSYFEPYRLGTTATPNLNIFNTEPIEQPIWIYLRKNGTNYYAAYSLNGELWSPEAGPIVWAGTVDRFGMMLVPPSTATLTNAEIEVDWFNKIA